jgi:multiple sugar transport system substrate-binding protein
VKKEPILELIEQWNEKNPKIQIKPVEVTGSLNEYFQKVSTAFASGKGPDIFHMSPTEFLKYVESGTAYPVNEWSMFTEKSMDQIVKDLEEKSLKAMEEE